MRKSSARKTSAQKTVIYNSCSGEACWHAQIERSGWDTEGHSTGQNTVIWCWTRRLSRLGDIKLPNCRPSKVASCRGLHCCGPAIEVRGLRCRSQVQISQVRVRDSSRTCKPCYKLRTRWSREHRPIPPSRHVKPASSPRRRGRTRRRRMRYFQPYLCVASSAPLDHHPSVRVA